VTTLLAGDIGGTKTILRLVQAKTTGLPQTLLAQPPLHEQTYVSREFADLVPMVRQFMAEASDVLGNPLMVERACFGIAGPVVNNMSEVTNLGWSLTAERLERELVIEQVSLINDFAAISYGVLGLSERDLFTLQAIEPNPTAPIAILGAGTGLGEGFLIPLADGGHRVFSSEGGHADFAPRSVLEFQLLNYLTQTNNWGRVSIERVVSGMGIAAIYQFLRDRDITQESSALAEIFKIWKQEIGQGEKTVDLAAEVSKAALVQSDYLSMQTMNLFIEAYGAEAGNLALKLLPYGGLYLAGGIAAKNLSLIQEGNFMRAFRDKGRMSSLLAKVPVHIILNPKVGLIGAALHAAQITS
jgi:glucokinase